MIAADGSSASSVAGLLRLHPRRRRRRAYERSAAISRSARCGRVSPRCRGCGERSRGEAFEHCFARARAQRRRCARRLRSRYHRRPRAAGRHRRRPNPRSLRSCVRDVDRGAERVVRGDGPVRGARARLADGRRVEHHRTEVEIRHARETARLHRRSNPRGVAARDRPHEKRNGPRAQRNPCSIG